MFDLRFVTSRILWVKFKFSRVKICVVVGYGPTEAYSEERERFWNDLDKVMYRVCNGHWLRMLEDLNEWVGDIVRVGITGAFGVPGEKDNRRGVVDFVLYTGCV